MQQPIIRLEPPFSFGLRFERHGGRIAVRVLGLRRARASTDDGVEDASDLRMTAAG